MGKASTAVHEWGINLLETVWEQEEQVEVYTARPMRENWATWRKQDKGGGTADFHM